MSEKSIKKRIAKYRKYLSRVGFDLEKSVGEVIPKENNWQKINPIIERLEERLKRKEKNA